MTVSPAVARVLDGAGHTVDVPAAARALGISRCLAYDLIKRNEFPTIVLRLGARYRVPVAALRRLLEEDPE